MRRAYLLPAAALLSVAMPAWAKQRADMILYNGKVITVDDRSRIVSAIAVRDGRIIAVGGEEVVQAYQAPVSLDLGGKTLMPGFIDTHVHIYGKSPRDIAVPQARSIVELQAMIRSKARAVGPGEWITGLDWDEYALIERRRPLRSDLDAAAPDNPVLLARAGGHSVAVNSRALTLAKIDRDTPDPAGGKIERDAAGEPNGIVLERTDIFYKLVPPDTDEALIPSIIESLRAELALGVTSLMEASTRIDDEPLTAGGTTEPPDWPGITYGQLKKIYGRLGDRLPRVTAYIEYPGEARLKAFGRRTGFGDDRLQLGPIGETTYDGGFTGPAAYTSQDYKGMPGYRGKTMMSRQKLQDMVDVSARLGWQLGIHAIGDQAIIDVVDAYDQALRKYPRADNRWFTSHFTMLPPAGTMDTMARDGFYAAAQPNFLYNLEGRYVEALEGERLQHINPVASPLKHKVKVVFGSDNLPLDPMVAIYVAVTRKGQSGTVYGPSEAVSREVALRLYTRNAAELSWDEAKKGSLEVGKFADMIVLSGDPLTVPEEQILKLHVEKTFVGGRLVFERKH